METELKLLLNGSVSSNLSQDFSASQKNLTLKGDDLKEHPFSHFLKAYYSLFLVLFGTFGNVMSLAVLCRKSFRLSPIGICLQCLALSDLLALYTGCGYFFMGSLFGYHVREASEAGCRVHRWLSFLAVDLSAWVLVLVSTVRVSSVIWPLKTCFTLRRTYIAMLVTFLVLAGINLPMFIMYGLRRQAGTQNPKEQCRLIDDSHKHFVYDIWPWIILVKFGFVPGTILIALNAILANRVFRSRKQMDRMQRPAKDIAPATAHALSSQSTRARVSRLRNARLFFQWWHRKAAGKKCDEEEQQTQSRTRELISAFKVGRTDGRRDKQEKEEEEGGGEEEEQRFMFKSELDSSSNLTGSESVSNGSRTPNSTMTVFDSDNVGHTRLCVNASHLRHRKDSDLAFKTNACPKSGSLCSSAPYSKRKPASALICNKALFLGGISMPEANFGEHPYREMTEEDDTDSGTITISNNVHSKSNWLTLPSRWRETQPWGDNHDVIATKNWLTLPGRWWRELTPLTFHGRNKKNSPRFYCEMDNILYVHYSNNKTNTKAYGSDDDDVNKDEGVSMSDVSAVTVSFDGTPNGELESVGNTVFDWRNNTNSAPQIKRNVEGTNVHKNGDRVLSTSSCNGNQKYVDENEAISLSSSNSINSNWNRNLINVPHESMESIATERCSCGTSYHCDVESNTILTSRDTANVVYSNEDMIQKKAEPSNVNSSSILFTVPINGAVDMYPIMDSTENSSTTTTTTSTTTTTTTSNTTTSATTGAKSTTSNPIPIPNDKIKTTSISTISDVITATTTPCCTINASASTTTTILPVIKFDSSDIETAISTAQATMDPSSPTVPVNSTSNTTTVESAPTSPSTVTTATNNTGSAVSHAAFDINTTTTTLPTAVTSTALNSSTTEIVNSSHTSTNAITAPTNAITSPSTASSTGSNITTVTITITAAPNITTTTIPTNTSTIPTNAITTPSTASSTGSNITTVTITTTAAPNITTTTITIPANAITTTTPPANTINTTAANTTTPVNVISTTTTIPNNATTTTPTNATNTSASTTSAINATSVTINSTPAANSTKGPRTTSGAVMTTANQSARRAGQSTRRADRGSQQRRHLTVTLLVINVAFLIFNAPIVIYMVGKTRLFSIDNGITAFQDLFRTCSNFFMYTNNASNFIFYCVTGSRFRQELKDVFREIACRKRV